MTSLYVSFVALVFVSVGACRKGVCDIVTHSAEVMRAVVERSNGTKKPTKRKILDLKK